MGLGVIYLVSRGKKDMYFNMNPDITFFKAVYKRHTNFSTENINQYFKTTPDFETRVSSTISKNAELLGRTYLYVELPSIPKSSNTTLPKNIKKFRWIDKIGYGIIKYADISIEGERITRTTYDWLNIESKITIKKGLEKALNIMIGNVPELTELTTFKNSYKLKIPLNFWFCKESGLYLPLVSMYHNDVNIDIEFNSLKNCYIESPNRYIIINEDFVLFDDGEYFEQTINGKITKGIFRYFDTTNKYLYYDYVNGDFTQNYDIIGANNNFIVTMAIDTIVVKDETFFKITPSLVSAYLATDYVYLDDAERDFFRRKNHHYIIPNTEIITEQTINNSNFQFKINIKNPSKALFWRFILQSNIKTNNIFDYSMDGKSIVEKMVLVINSNERVEIYDKEYFDLVEKFKSKLNTGKYIYMYSFSLEPFNNQPTGTMNFSKVDNAYLQLTLNKSINHQNPVNAIGFNYHINIFKIIDGRAGTEFSN